MAAGQCCHLRKVVADVRRRLVSAYPFGLGHDDVCVKKLTWHCTQDKNRLPESRLGNIRVTGRVTRVAGVVSKSENDSTCQGIPAVCDCPECDLKAGGTGSSVSPLAQ